MELANKTLIVTGASSGIGAAAARLFASEGANVVLAARRSDELQSVAEDITRGGGSVVYRAGDVLDEAYAGVLTELALERFGSLHGAFNNAGVVGDMVAVPDMSIDNWNRVISTNLTSAFWAAKAQVPILKEQGGGSIVFTSSFVGFSNGGLPGMAAYAASKAGLNGLVQSLAAEHAREASVSTRCCPEGQSPRQVAKVILKL